MDYEMDRDSMDMSHHVILEQREQLIISGVGEVERMDENSILLTTVQGELEIQGEELRLEKLSMDGGELKVKGRINALIYETEEGRRGGLFSRLLGG